MRSILHVDMNNFYASVECLYRPEIRSYPVAVAGDPLSRHGIILAKNMIAKAEAVLAIKASDRAALKNMTYQYQAGLETKYKGIEEGIVLAICKKRD